MSVGAMIEEHSTLDELISRHRPEINDWIEYGCRDLKHAKQRRCRLRDAIQVAVMKGDPDAVAYAQQQRWEIPGQCRQSQAA